MRDAQKQCLSLRQLCHYAYQHNVHASSIYERVNICAPIAKNEWIIFFSIPLIFVLQEESCVREVQSTTDYQQLNIYSGFTFPLLHLHIAKVSSSRMHLFSCNYLKYQIGAFEWLLQNYSIFSFISKTHYYTITGGKNIYPISSFAADYLPFLQQTIFRRSSELVIPFATKQNPLSKAAQL